MHEELRTGELKPVLEKEGEAELNLGGRPFTIRQQFVDDLAKHDQGEHC